jgi:hypothetical protein
VLLHAAILPSPRSEDPPPIPPLPFLCLQGSGNPSYPGGPFFNFAGMGKTEEAMKSMKAKELENGRLVSVWGGWCVSCARLRVERSGHASSCLGGATNQEE